MPWASNTASKAFVNFRSRSRMRNRTGGGRSLRVHVTCRACCVTPVRCANPSVSRGALIFVGQSAESIAANHGQRAPVGLICSGRPPVRRREVDASVSPMTVVMITEHRQHALEGTAIKKHEPVEAFRTNGPDKSFGDPVRLWHLDRRSNDSDTRALEHLVKASRKFSVVIANQDTHGIRAVDERPRQLTRLLRDPRLVGMRGTTGHVHASAGDLDEEQHVHAPKPDCVDGKEVDGDQAFGLRLKQLTPRRAAASTRWTEMGLTENLADRRR